LAIYSKTVQVSWGFEADIEFILRRATIGFGAIQPIKVGLLKISAIGPTDGSWQARNSHALCRYPSMLTFADA
jgi:hypothetical protein